MLGATGTFKKRVYIALAVVPALLLLIVYMNNPAIERGGKAAAVPDRLEEPQQRQQKTSPANEDVVIRVEPDDVAEAMDRDLNETGNGGRETAPEATDALASATSGSALVHTTISLPVGSALSSA